MAASRTRRERSASPPAAALPLLGVYVLTLLLMLAGAVIAVIGWVGLFLLVRFAFAPQVITIEGHTLRRSLRRSWDLTKGRWFHTALTIGLILFAVKLVSTTIGLIVLILFRPPFWVLTPVIAVTDALMSPIAGICASYLYGDVRGRARGSRRPAAAGARARSRPGLIDRLAQRPLRR